MENKALDPTVLLDAGFCKRPIFLLRYRRTMQSVPSRPHRPHRMELFDAATPRIDLDEELENNRFGIRPKMKMYLSRNVGDLSTESMLSNALPP